MFDKSLITEKLLANQLSNKVATDELFSHQVNILSLFCIGSEKNPQ